MEKPLRSAAPEGGWPGVNAIGRIPRMLNHVAYVTHDAQATVDFYTGVLGMELVSTVIDDSIPSTGDPFPYFHLFFRMADGSTIAFFESPGLPPAAAHSASDRWLQPPSRSQQAPVGGATQSTFPVSVPTP